MHAFNGDPHPGNYLFRPGGRVTFLDFGLVKYFTEREVYVLRRLSETIVQAPDPAAFRATLEDAGFLKRGAAVSDEELTEFFRPFYHFVIDEESGALDDKYAAFRTSRDDMPGETAAHYAGRTFYRFVPDARVLTWDNSRISLKEPT